MAHNIVAAYEPASLQSPAWSWRAGSAQRRHLDGDEHFRRTAGVRAAQRSDVAIVPTVAHPNVIFRESAPQRRVVGDPRAAPPLDPGVALALDHGVGLGVTTRMQVARDVTSRQADQAERAQGEMGEVLADSLASGPHVDGLGVHWGAASGVVEPVDHI